MLIRDTADFERWFAERCAAHSFRVEQVPLDELDGWRTDPETGNLHHRTGRFFSVEGLRITATGPVARSWAQPVIRQTEHGVLGILLQRHEGVPHVLLQAKTEPGNINAVQLSPTVQATVSNYTRVHRGSAVRYLEHFLRPRPGTVRYDALQSEQGSWFLAKRNRNMIVELPPEQAVDVHDDYCWVPLPVLPDLLRVPHLVNMDTRTVLAGLPRPGPPPRKGAPGKPLHTWTDLQHHLTRSKLRHRVERCVVPLREADGWHREDGEIRRDDGRFFRIIGVEVSASSREVTSWAQPMLAPASQGVVAFLSKEIGGVRHLLVQVRYEAGTADVCELAPTVQCAPGNLPVSGPRPPFLDTVLQAPTERVLFDTVHSEEGGRFHHAANRYVVVEAAGLPLDVPETHMWVSVDQLTRAAQLGGMVNVEARCLLTCVHTLPGHGQEAMT
ncbi:NDP-hexose 2,3-dehydratase family protein [Streptomyces thermoviolaceus]|uniref:NDP-hexose 2,3-dehydratase family protein n=1 Tax=Streptomyces thermoviolaceus TaxID=1952 RepID=UPI0019C2D606|nr:NDP-hexose 2,3-dehydratase family protein [Streptomyces thermoviolaceus]MCM3264794.1 NDP-hexose 2,3-dehydratase family protein [Streptomyces thermoviolaceus]WTD48906.1 NDP-hexose 2,3-dehydratase family protein [Streptomyces thermoviolaceus]GHB08673.1 NDP-hexose 2,3-dehydratase [Streptomyces thermoviolaceus subsp. thermoviolaceus]